MAEQTRRTAKAVIQNYAFELMERKNDPMIDVKLNSLITICMRMGWIDLEKQIRAWFRWNRNT